MKKFFFKKVSKFEPKEGTKMSSKRELKFAPLDPKGFATQPTYQQVKVALLVAIDKKLEANLLNIRSCIELKVHEVPPEPVKARPTGMADKEIEDAKEHNGILYKSTVMKWVGDIEKNAIKVFSLIWDKFTSKSTKDKLEQLQLLNNSI